MAGFFKKIGRGISNFFGGTPDKLQQISNLRPDQEGLYNQLNQAGMGPGAGGAFGQAADYYRGLLGNNPEDFQSFANPAIRQYNEEIVPGLSEQFASMGSGGLSSSGFNLAQQQGNVDLAERLGAIRAQLRQSGAQGLQNIGQLGLGNYSQYYNQPGTPGFLSNIAPAIGTGIGMGLGGPIGGAIGSGVGSWFGGSGNKVGQKTSPLTSNNRASPIIPNNQGMSGSTFGGY